VEQDPKDEPASAVSISSPNRHRDSELSAVLCPIELPNSWQWTTLASISVQITDGEHATPPRIPEQEVPLVTAKNVRDGFLDYSHTDWVSLETANKAWQRCRPTVGDVLLVCVGATTGRLCVLREARDMVLVRSVALIRANSTINVDYLATALRSPMSQSQIWAQVKVTAQPCLYINRINSITVPVPPLAEQHRIVAKVDELMSLCDRLEAAQEERESWRVRLVAASLHRLNQPADTDGPEVFRKHARSYLDHLPRLTTRPEQIKQLRQTILNLAVRGKLVPQDPNDEPASELLKRIRVKQWRRVKDGKRQGETLTSIDCSQGPFALPTHWTWAHFPELGVFGRGKSKHRPRNDPSLFEGGTHPLVQTGDVARSHGLIKTYTSKYNDLGLAQSVKWPAGALCITIAANIADSGILSFDACFPDSVVGFIPSAEFPSARYFDYFLRTAKADLLQFAPATAQKNINLEILNAVLIPLPPLAEQQRIVARADELMSLCDQLEAQITSTQAESRRLLDAILHEALATTTHRETP
jgi:type I restriction enzyme S subunit